MYSRKAFVLSLFVLMFSGLATAQNKVAQELDHRVSSVEHEFVSAAQAMPEDKYSFVPTAGEFKGVRTFAQQVKHVAATNYEFAAVIKGEKPSGDEAGPEPVKSKADILTFLQGSFEALHQAIATIDEKNIVEPMKNPWGGKEPVTRLGMAVLAAQHPWDHYGQMVVYMRMNGIVPPASR